LRKPASPGKKRRDLADPGLEGGKGEEGYQDKPSVNELAKKKRERAWFGKENGRGKELAGDRVRVSLLKGEKLQKGGVTEALLP